MRDTTGKIRRMVEEEDVNSGKADKRIDVQEEDAVECGDVRHDERTACVGRGS